MKTRAPKVRTYSVLTFFIALKAGGNLSLAWGLKHLPEMSGNPLSYVWAALDPFVVGGIGALMLAMLARMALFSMADLSYVLPVTAVGYLLATVLGKTVLHENVTQQRWIGTVLIVIGAALVGTGSHKTEIEIE